MSPVWGFFDRSIHQYVEPVDTLGALLAPVRPRPPAPAPTATTATVDGTGGVVRPGWEVREFDVVATGGVPAGDDRALWTFLHARLRPPTVAAAADLVPVTHALGDAFAALARHLPPRPDAVLRNAAAALRDREMRHMRMAFVPAHFNLTGWTAAADAAGAEPKPFPAGFLRRDGPVARSVPQTFAWLCAFASDAYDPIPLLPHVAAAAFAPLSVGGLVVPDIRDADADPAAVWGRITEPPPRPAEEERTGVSYLGPPAADAAVPAEVAGFRLAHLRGVATASDAATDADNAADDRPPVPGLIVYAHAPDAGDAGEAGLLPSGRHNLPRDASVVLRLLGVAASAEAARRHPWYAGTQARIDAIFAAAEPEGGADRMIPDDAAQQAAALALGFNLTHAFGSLDPKWENRRSVRPQRRVPFTRRTGRRGRRPRVHRFAHAGLCPVHGGP
jgi:hypothetical protein